jgi:uncharacterized protein YcbK (DUF882 family)
VFPDKESERNIERVAMKMQTIRDYFGRPIYVTSWYRPEKYNELIGGSKNSWHMKGLAVDFLVQGLECAEVRDRLENKLEKWDLRMEDWPEANWVHVDLGTVINKRYFKK